MAKAQSRVSSSGNVWGKFCLFLIYSLIFYSLKGGGGVKPPLSGLYHLVPYRSGDTRAAGERLSGKSNEGRKHQLFQERTRPCTFPHVWASMLDSKHCDERR